MSTENAHIRIDGATIQPMLDAAMIETLAGIQEEILRRFGKEISIKDDRQMAWSLPEEDFGGEEDHW